MWYLRFLPDGVLGKMAAQAVIASRHSDECLCDVCIEREVQRLEREWARGRA